MGYNPTMASTVQFDRTSPSRPRRTTPRQVAENLGLCFGLIVRSMGVAEGFTASFSAMRSGEVDQYTEVLEDSRRHAVNRVVRDPPSC